MLEIKSTKQEKYCSKCGEILEKGYIQGYCRTCKSEYQKQYREDNKEHLNEYQKEYRETYYSQEYIYILWGVIDGVETPLYCGSTCRPHRINEHLRSYNGTNAKTWVEGGIYKVTYADVTDLVETRRERFYLEDLYILELDPVFNKGLNNVKIEEGRMEILGELMYNELIEFYVLDVKVDIKKDSHDKEEISFNHKNLILV